MASSSSRWSLAEALAELCEGAPDGKFLTRLVDQLAEELDCERIFVFWLRARGGFRVLFARSRDRETLARPTVRMSHYAVSKAMAADRILEVPDARKDRRYRPEEVLQGRKGPVSILVIPLHVEGDLHGGVYADHRFRSFRLEPKRVDAVKAWVHLLGLALRLRGGFRTPRGEGGRAEAIPQEGPDRSAAGGGASEVGGASAAGTTSAVGGPSVEVVHGFLTANPDLKDLFDTVRSLERSSLPVIIHGEAGVGKSLLAFLVHASSVRREKPFFTVNPAAVPESLIESELLGHVKGAFTGAESDQPGAFVLADRGTVFIDEIADMTLEFQKKLLRVLEDGWIRPLGAKSPVRVDVRLITCTSRDLEKLVRQGRFRRDLYYRLKGVVLEIPPLRERKEDITPLAEHFLNLHAREENRQPPRLGESARAKLIGYHWPGNVRELQNEMRRLVAMGLEMIEAGLLAPFLRGRPRKGTESHEGPIRRLDETVEQAEREAIEDALRLAGGNKSRAASALGITRKALYRRMEKYRLRG